MLVNPLMEQFMLLTLVLIAATPAFLYCTCAGIRRRREGGGRPPGPIGLPLIGHLHVLGSLPHQTLARLSHSYGPLMSLRLGSVPLLVASSAHMAKLILHTHDKVLCGRPQMLSVPQITFNSMDISFCSPGPYWRFMRQLCVTQFFSAKRLDYFQQMRQQEVHGLLRSILAAQGTPISIREKLQTATSNVMSRMTLGTPLQELGSASKCLPRLQELFELMSMFNVSDYMPWLAWMDVQGIRRRSKKAAPIANSMLQEVIDRRRALDRSPDDLHRDFLDVLLMASKENSSHLDITDQHIKAVMMDMFVGGTDTTSSAVEWAMAELLANPKKLMILRKEIDEVVGSSRLLEERDVPNLRYLRSVVYETLRLHPISPLLVPHMTTEPCQISGYHIPTNTLVNVNAWAIHRDPAIWSHPLEFSPERFLDSNIDILSQDCKFLPFGGGRRMCPAWKLALLTVQSVLGSLIHAFDWKTLSTPHDMTEKYGPAVVLEDPLVIVPMPKVPNDLFERIV